MNHDRLTLYYRSTISHFLLDLLNPTGTGVGAAAPLASNHLAALEEGRVWPNKDQAEPVGDLGSKITDNAHAKQVPTVQYTNCTMFC